MVLTHRRPSRGRRRPLRVWVGAGHGFGRDSGFPFRRADRSSAPLLGETTGISHTDTPKLFYKRATDRLQIRSRRPIELSHSSGAERRSDQLTCVIKDMKVQVTRLRTGRVVHRKAARHQQFCGSAGRSLARHPARLQTSPTSPDETPRAHHVKTMGQDRPCARRHQLDLIPPDSDAEYPDSLPGSGVEPATGRAPTAVDSPSGAMRSVRAGARPARGTPCPAGPGHRPTGSDRGHRTYCHPGDLRIFSAQPTTSSPAVRRAGSRCRPCSAGPPGGLCHGSPLACPAVRTLAAGQGG